MESGKTKHPVRDAGEPVAADPRRWKALAVLSVAQFMLILDITVVTVALPGIDADLGLGRLASALVISAYTLLFGGVILLGGRLADTVGARTMLMIGLALFTLASLASGLAQSSVLLIGGRIGQGIAAALMSPAALSSIPRLFQGKERVKALAVWSSLGGIGFALGVLFGGVLTAGPGWRWIFFVNIPVGVVLLVCVPALLPRFAGSATRRIDVFGSVLITGAVGSFIYGMLRAGNAGWGSAGTILPIVAAVLLGAVFVLVERVAPVPLLRLSLLTRRPVATGTFLMFVASGLSTGSVFLGSQYLQHLRQFDALGTGLFFLPVAVATAIGARSAGRLVGAFGARTVAAAGLTAVAVGNGLLIAVPADGNVLLGALPGFVLAGLGAGSQFVVATTSALGTVGPQEAGLVSGLIYTFHELGPAVLVALVSTVAVAGLADSPEVAGFRAGFVLLTVISAVAAVFSLILVPSTERARAVTASGAP
jgi:EmrB/QacA subfamily drug resistance transporter